VVRKKWFIEPRINSSSGDVMNEKSLKVLVCFLMVALAATSGLAVTFYRQQTLLQKDFEKLQESYGQLQNSYTSLQQEYQRARARAKSFYAETSP